MFLVLNTYAFGWNRYTIHHFCNIFEGFSKNPESYSNKETVDGGVEEFKEHEPVSVLEANKNLKKKTLR